MGPRWVSVGSRWVPLCLGGFPLNPVVAPVGFRFALVGCRWVPLNPVVSRWVPFVESRWVPLGTRWVPVESPLGPVGSSCPGGSRWVPVGPPLGPVGSRWVSVGFVGWVPFNLLGSVLAPFGPRWVPVESSCGSCWVSFCSRWVSLGPVESRCVSLGAVC